MKVWPLPARLRVCGHSCIEIFLYRKRERFSELCDVRHDSSGAKVCDVDASKC